MAMNLRLSSSASGTRNVTAAIVNMGGGANMMQRSLFSSSTPTLAYSNWYVPGNGSPAISTADYYLMNGIYWSQPYDLDTMSTHGATIKAREGFRYVWMMGTDHPEGANFQGSGDFYVGYSDDPQVWPDPSTLRMLRRQDDSITVVDQNGATQNNFVVYQLPRLVYNPDAAGDKFWIYAESLAGPYQHELGLFTTSDFLTTTLVEPVIPTTSSNGWTSFGFVERIGTGNWVAYSFGRLDYVGGDATTPLHYKYTSTDGRVWTADYSTVRAGAGPYVTISGQKYLITIDGDTSNNYISLLAVSATNVSQTTQTHISDGFGPTSGYDTCYPGPTFLQSIMCHEESGIATLYATRGFFTGGPTYRQNLGPYLNYSPTYFTVTGTVSGTTFLVSANPSGYPILPGFQIVDSAAGQVRITADNGGGNYTLNTSGGTIATPTSFAICRNGALWQQFIDMYRITTDATAAASAAPLGVTADCVAGVVTISWNNCLPHQNYRVYRGTSKATQATLIGDVTGTSITDTPTPGSQYFYKVVTMNSGEQGSRIVNVYASNNTRMVNRHVNRVVNDGGDTSKIDMTFLASVDSYLTTNNYYRYLMHWVDARFGVKLDGSGFVSKVYCLGTTQLPRGGDYTPTTSNTFPSTSSNTSYSASSFRGTTPSWVNNANTAHGYFGNGRANIIQRKNELTLIGAYQKSHTNSVALFGYGSNSGMYLTHGSGSTGNCTFAMANTVNPPGTYKTATAAFASATAAHVLAGVFDGSTITAILDGVAGTPTDASAFANPTMLNDSVLRGMHTTTNATAPFLASGASDCQQTLQTRAYSFFSNEAQFTGAALIVFEKGLPAAVTGITALYA